MAQRKPWTRNDLLVAYHLYLMIPFGLFHQRNPTLITVAEKMGRSVSSLAMKLSNIASIDPTFRSTGRTGLKGASRADKQMWDEMSADWLAFVSEAKAAFDRLNIVRSANEFETDQTEDYTGKTRESTVNVRVGQHYFRKAVLSAYDYRCCITGLAVPGLLVASHILPWAEQPEHRLNPRNGLCLNVLHDKAFDRKIISLDKDFRVIVSRAFKKSADPYFVSSVLEYEGKQIRLPEKFMPEQEFLSAHREML